MRGSLLLFVVAIVSGLFVIGVIVGRALRRIGAEETAGLPVPPEHVRLVFYRRGPYGGDQEPELTRVVPLQCLYEGLSADGIHTWSAIWPPGVGIAEDEFVVLAMTTLPARTEVTVAFPPVPL